MLRNTGNTFWNINLTIHLYTNKTNVKYWNRNSILFGGKVKLVKMSRKEALSQFINQIHGRPVVVKLNSGVDYRGMLLFA